MLWQTIGGRCIYQRGRVKVFDNYFFRWLQIESQAYQTLIYKRAPHKYGLKYIEALSYPAQLQPGNCCVLGVGGGGILHTLSPYLKNVTLTAVDINADVIEIAQQYFQLKKRVNLEIITADASEFISNKHHFKHIVVDLFDANNFPTSCNNETFFVNCVSNLEPEGFLTINLANRSEQRPIFELIRQQFSTNTLTIPIKNCDNTVIIASIDLCFFLDQIKRDGRLKSLTWDAYWGYVAVMK